MSDRQPRPAPNESRRAFFKAGAFTALAGGVLAGCDPKAQALHAAKNTTPDSDQSGGSMAPHPVTIPATNAADEMDRMHEAGVKAFPATTAGKGNQLRDAKVVDGVKVYELTARSIRWETTPGTTVDAWAYDNQVPGPQIRVREGDRVRVVLKNELAESTSIHFHGLELPNERTEQPHPDLNCTMPGRWALHCHILPHAESQQRMFGMVTALVVKP